MDLAIIAGSANLPLAEAAAVALKTALRRVRVLRYPDGETGIDLEDSVRGDGVYLLQPTGPPVNDHLVELLLLADACRRDGAGRVTAVVPYFGYARQDERSGRSAIGGRLAAEILEASGVDGLVTVDLHTPAIEGFFSVPVTHLSAVALLAERVRPTLPDRSVVVAPDLGATKLAERYARILGLPVAFVHKRRLSGAAVEVRAVTGDVYDRAPLIVDDMISTGATIDAAARALLAAGARPSITVAATHALLVGSAAEALGALPLECLVVTNTLPPPREPLLPLDVVSVAELVAGAVRELHGHPAPAPAHVRAG